MHKKPNIMFIMSDDHSASAVSCYQSMLSTIFSTPNIDRIGKEGAIFHNYFATNSICTPARATIMTGQYGHMTNMRSLDDCWDVDSTENLALLLQNAGYDTALFGKWHLHCTPKGFSEYKYLTDQWEQGQYFNPSFEEKGKGNIRYNGYVSDIITEMTIDFLDNRRSEKPFFIMCNHKAPHDQWEYHKRYENLFDGVEIPMPSSIYEDKSHRCEGSREFGASVGPRNKVRSLYDYFIQPDYVTGQLLIEKNATFEEKTYSSYQKYLKDYLRTVAGVDDSVGLILNKLESDGILDETLIIYTSDQGLFLGEHDYQDKRWSYEESIKTPLLMRYPKEFVKEKSIEGLACNLDIAPTLLDFAGVSIPEKMQGVSIRSLLTGQKDCVRDVVYFRYWMHLAHQLDIPAHFGIRTQRYKLIYYYGLPLNVKGAKHTPTPTGWELYDLKEDPFELNNVFQKDGYKNISNNLIKQLVKTQREYKDLDCKIIENAFEFRDDK